MDNKALLLEIYQFVCVQARFQDPTNPNLKKKSEEIYEWINKVAVDKSAVKSTSRTPAATKK